MRTRRFQSFAAVVTALSVAISGTVATPAAGQSSGWVPGVVSGSTQGQSPQGNGGNQDNPTLTNGDEVSGIVIPHNDGQTIDFVVNEDGLNATVTTRMSHDGHLTVEVAGTSEGNPIHETFDVRDFTITGDQPEDFIANLVGKESGEAVLIDGETATTQAVPALIILGLLARVGLRAAINWYGRTQVKKAAKSYLLGRNANSWNHIMKPKHCWNRVGAHSREQIAELMSRAMSEGQHGPYNADKQAVWHYGGQTIVVTYNKDNGAIGNGWVRC